MIVDTSAWIELLRGRESAERVELQKLIEEEAHILLTELIFAEVLQGVRDDGQFHALQSYFRLFPILKPAGLETYVKTAEIYRTCRRKGATIRSICDCLVAAIALENHVPIFHKDRDYTAISKHFPLRIHTPSGAK